MDGRYRAFIGVGGRHWTGIFERAKDLILCHYGLGTALHWEGFGGNFLYTFKIPGSKERCEL